MARSPSSPIILPCPAKRVSAFSLVDYRLVIAARGKNPEGGVTRATRVVTAVLRKL